MSPHPFASSTVPVCRLGSVLGSPGPVYRYRFETWVVRVVGRYERRDVSIDVMSTGEQTGQMSVPGKTWSRTRPVVHRTPSDVCDSVWKGLRHSGGVVVCPWGSVPIYCDESTETSLDSMGLLPMYSLRNLRSRPSLCVTPLH